MDFQKLLLDFSQYIMQITMLYLVFDAISNHYFLGRILTNKAQLRNDACKQAVTELIEVTDTEMQKFHAKYPGAGQFDPFDQKRELHIRKLSRIVTTAASGMALLEDIYPPHSPMMIAYKSEIHRLLGELKDLYTNVRGMEPKDAEQSIIDDCLLTIADCDLNGDIIQGTTIPNPAVEYFRDNTLEGTERIK